MKLNSIYFVLIFIIFPFHFLSAQQTSTINKSGFIPAEKIFQLLYVPFEVPEGTTEIVVTEEYDQMSDNVLNLGIYDPRGYKDGNVIGFRGWSGGAKKNFFISEEAASTGYVPGKIYSGTWNILVYPSKISAKGLNWKLTIGLTAGTHKKEFVVQLGKEVINHVQNWYRGDLHMHTLHSDGKRNTDELVSEAKEKKLDFIVSTEHNTNSANLSWGKYDSQNLLIINGEEVTTTKDGHWNAIGLSASTLVDWRYQPEDNLVKGQIDKVHMDNGLAIINHPFYDKGTRTFNFDVKDFDGIEIWNGYWNALNEKALNWWDDLLKAGVFKIAIGASDTHQTSGSNNNLGRPQTVVYSRGLSREEVISGIRSGQVYLAATDSIQLTFLLSSGTNKAGIGEVLSQDNTGLVTVHMNLKGCKNTTLNLIGSTGIIDTRKVNDDNVELDFTIKRGGNSYLRAELRKANGDMVAMTNPVWLKPFKK